MFSIGAAIFLKSAIRAYPYLIDKAEIFFRGEFSANPNRILKVRCQNRKKKEGLAWVVGKGLEQPSFFADSFSLNPCSGISEGTYPNRFSSRENNSSLSFTL